MKVAIIGAGGNGTGKARYLRDCQQVQEVLAYDISPQQIVRLREKCPHVTAVDSLESLWQDPAVKLVCISTPNDSHYELTVQALEAGKAVLCEKPMANTLAEAEAMVQAARRLGGFLQIGFELRYSTLYTTVKQWVDQGLLGKVLNTQCTYIASAFGQNNWRIQQGPAGSMFGEKLSHYVDLPRWWVGSEIEEVYAISAPNAIPYYQVRDNYHVTYRFANGAVSQLTFMMAPAATFRGDPLQNAVSQQVGDGHTLRYLVQGARGAAETDVFNRTIKRWAFNDQGGDFTSSLVETNTWDPQRDHFYFHNGYDQMLDVVRRVDQGLPPATPASDALETMRLCFAVEQSVQSREAVMLASTTAEPSHAPWLG